VHGALVLARSTVVAQVETRIIMTVIMLNFRPRCSAEAA
jgi:hypothetical protein